MSMNAAFDNTICAGCGNVMGSHTTICPTLGAAGAPGAVLATVVTARGGQMHAPRTAVCAECGYKAHGNIGQAAILECLFRQYSSQNGTLVVRTAANGGQVLKGSMLPGNLEGFGHWLASKMAGAPAWSHAPTVTTAGSLRTGKRRKVKADLQSGSVQEIAPEPNTVTVYDQDGQPVTLATRDDSMGAVFEAMADDVTQAAQEIAGDDLDDALEVKAGAILDEAALDAAMAKL
jgi:hypothetical protein